ncbi:MAG TPA: NAD(P)H-hydrate dehydratase [Gemmatimonadaceae bacterium]|nr:NAD(P)H-hydrate dehydratase [Gemmatimonadaceae bacterium]
MPVWVTTAGEAAERDRSAIESGTSSRVLMQRAGRAAADEIARRYAGRMAKGVAVFTGPGNNGGDGWVVARELAAAGVAVTVVEAAPPKSPDAAAEKRDAFSAVTQAGSVGEAGIAVDALLGTGSSGEPRGELGAGVDALAGLRARGVAIVSLDVPTGLDATTGAHSERCVNADLTLSFGGIKRGHLLARDRCGKIVVLDIGLPAPADAGSHSPLPMLVDEPFVKRGIPPLRYDSHKGSRKHLAVVGGGAGMAGAAVLATRAALRSGIGLVRVIVAPESLTAVVGAVPAAMVSDWSNASGASRAINGWADAIVIGPGLGKSHHTRDLIERILRDSTLPVLLDADGLNVFENETDVLSGLLAGRAALLTPHPAEFARLAGTNVKTVLDSRFEIGQDLAKKLNVTILLKGTPTTIFSPHGQRFVSPRGTAALATGGSGDILAGIAGTLLAQTADPVMSATCAAWIHGRAAELCGYVRGTTLDDVLYALPRAWNEMSPQLREPVLAELPEMQL